MNYFRGVGMFGSAFLGAHLMRGAAAAALLAWAIVHQTAQPWPSVAAGVAALVALRGCPMCWTVGLVETLSQGRRDPTAEHADPTWAALTLRQDGKEMPCRKRWRYWALFSSLR